MLPAPSVASPPLLSNRITYIKKPNQCSTGLSDAVEETTGLLPNLAPIFFFCKTPSIDAISSPSTHHNHPLWKTTPPLSTPHNAQTLFVNCRHRCSSCVTRLAVTRRSVSGSVSQRKSSATVDELQTSHPLRVGGGGESGKGVDRQARRRERRSWR